LGIFRRLSEKSGLAPCPRIAKRLQRESDAVSTKIDQLNVMLEVEYEPKYDFDSSFEDAYGNFIETK